VNKEVGKRIYDTRKALGLTRKEIGDKMGLNESTIPSCYIKINFNSIRKMLNFNGF
jgi:transcriptional regulator with XRE-family HTH domain